jgi:hypothetical protein
MERKKLGIFLVSSLGVPRVKELIVCELHKGNSFCRRSRPRLTLQSIVFVTSYFNASLLLSLWLIDRGSRYRVTNKITVFPFVCIYSIRTLKSLSPDTKVCNACHSAYYVSKKVNIELENILSHVEHELSTDIETYAPMQMIIQ